MVRKIIFILLSLPVLVISLAANGQKVDSSSVKIYTRLSFYTYEKNGELLIHVPPALLKETLSIDMNIGDEVHSSWKGKPRKNILRLPFPADFKPASYKINIRISRNSDPGINYSAGTMLIILPYKPNEVKTDRLTGGLVVNRLPFFPFGFYCYSPVNPTLPEEEVVRGFNMMSPYQRITPETLHERQAYMDRCAELGMKVNYNLLSVSGGGGVGSNIEKLSDTDKRNRLISEIKTFRDHPALLGWYISDEPNGYKILPEKLEEIYRIVKENDPWHPVSIVFMAPFLASKKYAGALDIVMADPYPIPDAPASLVGDIAGQLKAEFTGKNPVWMAQQAFGGGELWGREPTLQEIRSMTWQSIIKGATGIQYFVRQGLNYFPKSIAAWSECGRLAMEVAELTPWLLSDEESIPVESSSKNIIVSSRLHDGQLLIIAVNKINEPSGAGIRIKGAINGTARLPFENRTLTVRNGLITDQIAPFGSQAYLISLRPEKESPPDSNINLVKDPGFEDSASPGIPSACYARPGGDRGATYFLDTRVHTEGNHSVRLITPTENKGISLRFYPFSVKAGASYVISVWAKSDPEQRSFIVTKQYDIRHNDNKPEPQYVEILLGGFVHARFEPDSQWRRYVTFITIPEDTTAKFKTNLIMKMPGKGVAWFDQIKVYEEKSEH